MEEALQLLSITLGPVLKPHNMMTYGRHELRLYVFCTSTLERQTNKKIEVKVKVI
jgi:hypothetical protein